MQYLPVEPYRRAVYLVFYILLGAVAVYLLFRYALPVLLPFLLAFGAATLLRRPSSALAEKLHLRKKTASVLLAVLAMLGAVGLFLLAAGAAVDQLAALARGLVTGENAILESLSGVLGRLTAFLASLPLLKNGGDAEGAVSGALSDLLKNGFLELVSRLPALAGHLVTLVPKILFSSAVTVLSAVWFSASYEEIIAFVRDKSKGLLHRLLRELYGQTGKTLVKFFRSYFVLFLFTFGELFLGLLILRQRFAFLLALLTAFVDILPVLGTGAVLLPWSLYLFLAGDVSTAVGLLILYGVVAVLRQFLEPRIVGAGVGMSPLLSLFSLYVGYEVFGFWGLLLVPFGVVMVRNTVLALRRARQEGGT